MTAEEEVIMLREELALERAKVHELSAALAAAVSADAHAKRVAADRKAQRAAQNRAAYERRKQVQQSIQHAESGAETPSPSLPPPSSSPSLSAPISPPPISSPNPSSPPSFSLSASEPLPGKPAKKAKEAKKGGQNGSDPRHAPLVKALVETCGYPFLGGKDAKAVTALLALADQQEATRGDAAGLEVVRRARIGWAWVGFPSCRSLTELRDHWGHYAAEQQVRGQGPPDFRRGSVRAELIDHTKPEEPF